MIRISLCSLLVAGLVVTTLLVLPREVSHAGDPPQTNPSTESDMTQRFNVPLKTIGGSQLWTDFANRQGYRIQQNSLTGHWRLLDAEDVRQAWGTREACQAKLDELKPSGTEIAASGRPTVVLLHGLMRTHHSFKPLEIKLAKVGYPNAIRFSYASTRRSISDHAAALREVLESQAPGTEFCFVGHSMGNIVVRHLIGDLQRDGDPAGLLPRCQAMVMLGPPNQGAAIARRLAPTGLYGWVTGKGGMELGPQWEALKDKLATPDFPFTIIAGDVSNNAIQNPLVDGSSDFVVSLEEAALEGAEDLRTLPALHSFLMNDPKAIDWTIEFLDSKTKR